MIDITNGFILLAKRLGLLFLIVDVIGREFMIQEISTVNIIAIVVEKSY